MNPLYKGLEPQPDTFYKCIDFYGDDGIEYCTPDGSTLVFAKDTLEIPYPFPDVYVFAQVYDRQSRIPPEAIPREVSVCDRMSVCWMLSSEFGMLMLAYPQGMNHSVLEKGYGKGFRFMYSLADFGVLHYGYYIVPGLGSLVDMGSSHWFTPTPDHFIASVHKLIPRDFFGGPELYEDYGISRRELDEFFDCGDFQSWEGLPQDHCFYRYGNYVFYISSGRKLAEEDIEPCWFKWAEDYNCYVQVYSPGHIICAKAKPMPGEPTIGCVDNGFSDKIELALREGKLGNGMCSLGEALARVMDNSTDNVIFVGDWEFILDYENRRIQYVELKAFEDKTEWPFLEMADWISFE